MRLTSAMSSSRSFPVGRFFGSVPEASEREIGSNVIVHTDPELLLSQSITGVTCPGVIPTVESLSELSVIKHAIFVAIQRREECTANN